MLFIDIFPKEKGEDILTEGDFKYYFLDGVLHREEGPAVDGGKYKEYWNKGVRQKIVWPNGVIKVYKKGKCDGNVYMYNHLKELCVIGTEADECYKIN